MTNAYLYTYKGEPIQVLPQNEESDLVQVGEICVRIGKVCLLKNDQAVHPCLKIVRVNGRSVSENG